MRQNPMIPMLLLAAFAVVSGAPPAVAGVATYAIACDAQLDSRDPTCNFGASTAVKVVVNGADGSLARVVFALPAETWTVPAGQLVVEARVFYRLANTDRTAERTVELHPLTRGFAEGTGDGTVSGDGATWLAAGAGTAWSAAGGDYGAACVTAAEGNPWFSWDILPLWNDANLRANGALLKMDNEALPPPNDPNNMPRSPFYGAEGPGGYGPCVQVTTAHPGDANVDGAVDLQDFGVLKDRFGLTAGGQWRQGDFNRDGAIDLQDFGILKDHFGHTDASVPAAPAPEPGTAVTLLAMGLLGPIQRRRTTRLDSAGRRMENASPRV